MSQLHIPATYDLYIPGEYRAVYDWRQRRYVERVVFDLGRKPVLTNGRRGDELLDRVLPFREEVADVVREAGRPMTMHEIAAVLGCDLQRVKQTVYRHKCLVKVGWTEGARYNKRVLYDVPENAP